jgi:ABC-type branched-subunit amino acid transport system ATPase component
MNMTELAIEGLFGKFDVKLGIKDNRLILIGPNGSGKSTIINILYFVLSRLWMGNIGQSEKKTSSSGCPSAKESIIAPG